MQPESLTRRQLFGRTATGIGTAALASLLNAEPSHYVPKAKRVIYLSMNGAPSQLDLFDYKPKLAEHFDKDLPDSIRKGQRITTMTSGQARLPVAPSTFKFAQAGQCGAWMTEKLPHLATVADDLAIVRSVNTEAINHDPACTYIYTGSPTARTAESGRMGLVRPRLASISDLPAFVVLHSTWTGQKSAQAVFARLWGSGFLPSEHQGVAFRSSGDPVLYLANPAGVSNQTRRKMLDALQELNEKHLAAELDPEIQARIAQYEMAYRMQQSIPDLTNFSHRK